MSSIQDDQTPHGTPQEQGSPGAATDPGAMDIHWAEFQFHDPRWLTWWLSSLYLLPPAAQLEIAHSLRQTVYSTQSQVVLAEFIEHLEGTYGEAIAPQETDPLAPSPQWWELVIDEMKSRFRPYLFLAVLFVGALIFSII